MWVELADENGIVETGADDQVTVVVNGPAVLAALGSAAPATTESFADDTHATYRGRALAVIRGTGEPGTVTVSATSTRHGSASAQLEVAASVDDVLAARS